jgi:hypothetical protein
VSFRRREYFADTKILHTNMHSSLMSMRAMPITLLANNVWTVWLISLAVKLYFHLPSAGFLA